MDGAKAVSAPWTIEVLSGSSVGARTVRISLRIDCQTCQKLKSAKLSIEVTCGRCGTIWSPFVEPATETSC